MYYYTKEIDGEIFLYSGTKLPKNMDGVVVITEEEYRQEQIKIDEAIAAEVAEMALEASEQDYLTALEVLGVSE